MADQQFPDSDSSPGTMREEAASAGLDDEQHMSAREALDSYRPAALWAVLMSLASVMEGFNIPLGGGMILFPPFEEKYGTFEPGLGYVVTAKWQTALGLAATVGGIFGVLIGGYLIERMGARWTIMISQVFISGAIFIQFFAPSMPVLFAGTIINGVPWGMISSVGPIYASEVCPTALRGYTINLSNISWTFGGLLSSIVLQAKVTDNTEWSYKLPFALQWMWPLPLFIIAALAPDSPWWLVRRGQMNKAKAAIRRLSRRRTDEQVDAQLAMMLRTNEYEEQAKTESNYKDIFKGANLRRTEIACFALSSQGLTGSNLAQNPTYVLAQIGLSNLNAFRIGCAAAAIGVLGNFISWFFMAKFGRRSLYNFGLIGMAITLLFIGILDSYPSAATIWTQAGLSLLWDVIFSVFVAPESYTIAGEISATRVRAQTLSFAKSIYGFTAAASAIGQANLTNPTGANIKGKSAYIWLGFTMLYIVWSFLRLPETKGKTYQEIDMLFEGRVSARNFDHQTSALIGEIDQHFHVHAGKSADLPRE